MLCAAVKQILSALHMHGAGNPVTLGDERLQPFLLGLILFVHPDSPGFSYFFELHRLKVVP